MYITSISRKGYRKIFLWIHDKTPQFKVCRDKSAESCQIQQATRLYSCTSLEPPDNTIMKPLKIYSNKAYAQWMWKYSYIKITLKDTAGLVNIHCAKWSKVSFCMHGYLIIISQDFLPFILPFIYRVRHFGFLICSNYIPWCHWYCWLHHVTVPKLSSALPESPSLLPPRNLPTATNSQSPI